MGRLFALFTVFTFAQAVLVDVIPPHGEEPYTENIYLEGLEQGLPGVWVSNAIGLPCNGIVSDCTLGDRILSTWSANTPAILARVVIPRRYEIREKRKIGRFSKLFGSCMSLDSVQDFEPQGTAVVTKLETFWMNAHILMAGFYHGDDTWASTLDYYEHTLFRAGDKTAIRLYRRLLECGASVQFYLYPNLPEEEGELPKLFHLFNGSEVAFLDYEQGILLSRRNIGLLRDNVMFKNSLLLGQRFGHSSSDPEGQRLDPPRLIKEGPSSAREMEGEIDLPGTVRQSPGSMRLEKFASEVRLAPRTWDAVQRYGQDGRLVVCTSRVDLKGR